VVRARYELNLYVIYKFSSYLTGNTIHHRYEARNSDHKDRRGGALQGNLTFY
jgi:hypothetical protein